MEEQDAHGSTAEESSSGLQANYTELSTAILNPIPLTIFMARMTCVAVALLCTLALQTIRCGRVHMV